MKECPMKGRGAQCAVNSECIHQDFLSEAAKSPVTPEQMLERISRPSLDPMQSLLGVLDTDPHKLALVLVEIINNK